MQVCGLLWSRGCGAMDGGTLFLEGGWLRHHCQSWLPWGCGCGPLVPTAPLAHALWITPLCYHFALIGPHRGTCTGRWPTHQESWTDSLKQLCDFDTVRWGFLLR